MPRSTRPIGTPLPLLRLVPLLCAVVWAMGWAMGAMAAPDFPDRSDRGKRFNGWEVQDFQVVGLPPALAGKPEQRLVLSGQRKLLGVKRSPFKADLLQADMTRLRLYLAQQGYPLARLAAEFDPDPAGGRLSLVLRVDPGPPTRVGGLSYAGWPENLDRPRPGQDLDLVPGAVFRDQDVKNSRARLRRLLQDSGYARPELQFSLNPVPDSLLVAVHWTVNSGPFAVVDSLLVEGCRSDLIPLVRRVSGFRPGRPFAEKAVQAMAADLRRTQLFRQIDLKTEELNPGHLLLRARLEDARWRSWNAGVGTWSDNPWQVDVGWTHRNLFSHGVGFQATASLATHHTQVGGGVFWLGWLERRARTRVGLEFLEEDEDAFRTREERLDLVQVFSLRGRDAVKLGMSASNVDVTLRTEARDISQEMRPGRLLELWLDWKRDRTDDPIAPGRGHYTKLSLSWGVPFGVSASPYAMAQGDAAWFQPLPGRWTLATRGRLGLARPLGDATELLPNRRFFAGGFNTMRGRKRRELGPLDSQGNPLGGQATLLAGMEIRRPLWKIVHGALFLDGGQVWSRRQDLSPGDMVWAGGLSLDFMTPVGPVRVNHAWNVDPGKDGRPRRLWSAGIGYPW